MLDKFEKLQIEAHDKKISKIKVQPNPKNGWSNAIRSSMSMPLSFVAKNLGLSTQAIHQLEQSEAEENISLKNLRRLAEAINCELHYALIPKQKSLKKTVEKQALIKAQAIVGNVDATMSLEGQKIKSSKKSVKLLAKELAENPNSKLWNDNA